MKKLSFLILNITAITLIISCDSDYLDQTPSDSISSSTMWTSEALIDQGVTGIYQTLRTDEVGKDRWRFDETGFVGMGRDNSGGFYSGLTGGITTPGSGIYSTYWQTNYEGIHRANDAIKNIPLNSKVLAADKAARLVAEAKFLRAWFYFNLNMVYKGVPLYLEPIEVKDANKPRETEDKIWQTIIADLTDCINTPSLPNMATGTEFGKVSKAAAYTLRGKAYLYWKKYQQADSDLTVVGTLGPKLFDGTGGKYKLLFTVANETDSEMIFSVQNLEVTGLNSNHQLQVGNRSTNGSDWNNDMYHPDYVDSYENADGSKFNWDTYLPDYSIMTPKQRSVFFLRDNMTAAEKTKMTSYGSDMSKYLATGNEARLKAAYASRDPRLEVNVLLPYSTFVGAVNATYTLRWPYRTDASPTSDTKTDTNNFFYYLGRKWMTEGITVNRDNASIDQPLIRYADVVLMLAEALNEQGNYAAAITQVNKIRARVGHVLLQNINATAPTYVTGQANMRDRIRNERRWELSMEGHSLFDEMRWGTWKDNKFYAGNGVKEMWGNVTTPYSWRGDYAYAWPIPKTEVEMNPNLSQNPGWIN